MKLNPKTLNKLLNSDYIKSIYPMIDNIDVTVDIEDSEGFVFNDITLKFYVNDNEMEWGNMHKKGFIPHYFIDNEMAFLLRFIGVKKSDIGQIFVSVIRPDGKVIYG